MSRFAITSILCTVTLLTAVSRIVATDDLPRLIRQLGADRFETRQEAQLRLSGYGPAAIPGLKAAARHDDDEVRGRAARLVERLQSAEHERLLSELLAEPLGAAPPGLPCWAEFAVLAGDDRAARLLYREMLARETELLVGLEDVDPRRGFVLSRRAEELQRELYFGRVQQLEGISPATVAVLLIASLQAESAAAGDYSPAATLEPLLDQLLSKVVIGEPPVEAATERPPLVRMLGAWVQTPEAASLHVRLSKSSEFRLPEGIVPARETLQSPAAALKDRADAVLIIARHGGLEHVPDLEPLLQDPTEVTVLRRRRQSEAATRMQDLALAALIRNHGAVRQGLRRGPDPRATRLGTSVRPELRR